MKLIVSRLSAVSNCKYTYIYLYMYIHANMYIHVQKIHIYVYTHRDTLVTFFAEIVVFERCIL